MQLLEAEIAGDAALMLRLDAHNAARAGDRELVARKLLAEVDDACAQSPASMQHL